MITKICKKCGRELPIDCFSKQSKNKDGLNIYCRECVAEKTKKYREEHLEEIKARKRIAYYRDKERANERTERELAKGNTKVCSRCGIEKPISEFRKRGNGGFYSRCKICDNDAAKQYARDNHEIVINRKRRYHKTHKAEIDAYNKQYYLSHKDEVKQRVREWETSNPEKMRERSVISRQKKRFVNEGLKSDLTRGQWKDCKDYFSEHGVIYCAYCGKPMKKATIDHVIPISAGGENTVKNVVPSCLKCNSSKFNHSMHEWFNAQPFYSEYREQKINAYLNQ